MKNLLVFLFVLLVFNSFSQLDIKEDKTEENVIGTYSVVGTTFLKLTEYKTEEFVSYIFLYKNLKYQQIVDYQSFSLNSMDDVNQLYDVISKQLPKKEKKDLEINLPNGDQLTLSFYKNKSVQFKVWNGSSWSYSTYLRQKQIDKLFGKI